jgi:BRCA1-associated protein
MYYYDLKLALYTTENIDLPTDFFGEFPHIDTEKTKYLENYNHPVPFQDRPRRSAPKSVTTHTRESIPPTPIHSAKHHIHNCLNERVDFRLGPVELTAFDVHTKTSSKKKKRELTEKNYSLGYGVFHLYRSLEQISEQDLPDTKIAKDESLNISHSQDDGTLVCILAVPSYMSHQDYINSLGPSNASIVSYRFIR